MYSKCTSSLHALPIVRYFPPASPLHLPCISAAPPPSAGLHLFSPAYRSIPAVSGECLAISASAARGRSGRTGRLHTADTATRLGTLPPLLELPVALEPSIPPSAPPSAPPSGPPAAPTASTGQLVLCYFLTMAPARKLERIVSGLRLVDTEV